MDTIRTDVFVDGARQLVEAEYAMFSGFSAPDCDVLSWDVEELVTTLMAATHKPRRWVEKGVFGYHRLRMLPGVKALQDQLRCVDVDRLAAIDRSLDVLPAVVPVEVWERIDAFLVPLLTPSPGRGLASIWSITNRLHTLLASVDPSIGYDPVKRKRREHTKNTATPSLEFYPVDESGVRRYQMALTTDAATMAVIRARVAALARERKTSMADAVIDRLVGELSEAVCPVMNFYTPKPARDGSGVFIPGAGWAGPVDADTLDTLAGVAKRVDLDEVAQAATGSYTPTEAMISLVRARDGVCIYPGCHAAATHCQIDHRIPYNQGGETTPSNLFLLCQTHHNRKTDKHAFYIPDPVTGEVVWLFSNGTWIIEDNKGIIHTNTTPTNPRWATTVGDYQQTRREAARFQAACHAAIDTYDRDGDLNSCIEKIRKLEERYNMTFDRTLQPEQEDDETLVAQA